MQFTDLDWTRLKNTKVAFIFRAYVESSLNRFRLTLLNFLVDRWALQYETAKSLWKTLEQKSRQRFGRSLFLLSSISPILDHQVLIKNCTPEIFPHIKKGFERWPYLRGAAIEEMSSLFVLSISDRQG